MRKLEYLTHGTIVSEKDAHTIENQGFEALEGRATVSGDLTYAFDWVTNKKRHEGKFDISQRAERKIIALNLPDNKEIFYDINDGGVIVNNERKEILGKTARYPSRRRHLAIYEKGKMVDLKNRQKLTVSKENILMSIIPDKKLGKVLERLKKKISNLESLDLDEHTKEIIEAIWGNKGNYIAQDIDEQKVIRSLLTTTVESIVTNRIRSWSLDIKKFQGYSIRDKNKGERRVSSLSPQKLMNKLLQLKERLNDHTFDTGIKEVDRYLQSKTNLLISELKNIMTYPRAKLLGKDKK